MVIELVQKGDKYLVRYKTGWFWWYVCYEDDWIWPDSTSYMDLKEAEEVIENKKYAIEQSRAKSKVIRTEEI